MNRFTGIVAAAAALALASAPPAEPAASEASPPAEQLVGKKDKLICENSQVTGTRMAKRKCRTKEEIRRQQEASRQKLDNIASRTQKGMTDDLGSMMKPKGPGL